MILSAIRYKWISFVDALEIDINEMRVDKLSMVMAVGLRLMLIADLIKSQAHQDEMNEIEAKEALQCYRTAAGIFIYVNENNKTDKLPDFLNETILEKLRIQCIAEAQIITVLRAIVSNHEILLIAKLCEGIYQQCWAASRINGNDQWQWCLNYKAEVFKALSRYYQGLSILENCEKFPELYHHALAVLQDGKNHYMQAYNAFQNINANIRITEMWLQPAQFELLEENLQNVIARTQKRCPSYQIQNMSEQESPDCMEAINIITPVKFILPSQCDQAMDISKDSYFLPDQRSDSGPEDQNWSFCCRIATFAILLPGACALSIAVCLSWLTLFLLQCFCVDNVCYEDAIAFCRSLMMGPYRLLLWAIGTSLQNDNSECDEKKKLLQDSTEKFNHSEQKIELMP